MGFKLAKKNGITVQFKKWASELRADPMHTNCYWNMVAAIKADNGGAWLRTNKNWVPMLEEPGNSYTFYDSHDKFEDSAEAESTVKLGSITGKKGTMAMNADENE